jgi:hypothetical protein
LKYIYCKEGWKSTDGKSRSVSSSCYIPEDSVFCSFICFESFMQEKIRIIKNSMSELGKEAQQEKLSGMLHIGKL